ncbi:putative ester cyclase [Silvimonas terrae]|uniref:Putative ester cyclase n=1 Tax=Silvimonas terrae TaxID=300266 RepID=A0A840RGV1_9NEIS|nr:ester cyclase [Silvimonas terrae]MBB5192849.1 putative ester cyclase [Silvimonas terrae]
MRLPTLILASALLTATLSPFAGADTDVLPQPHHLAATNTPDSASVILAARRYAAFWNTGDTRYADQALSPDFIDRTLPAGRVQGPQGPRQASTAFRTAVPDLTAEMEDVIVSQDRVAVHLHFKGHFTGHFGNVQGTGQSIDFQAFDLYRVADGRIAENWHLEDNLTLLQQMGIVQP